MNKPTTTKPEIKLKGRPERDGLFNLREANLVLADGKTFAGYVPEGQPDGTPGEVVFNTGMTGYVETLTDPSYYGQILTFTYPLIGNYGVASKDSWESQKMHLRGVIVSELAETWSHETGEISLAQWLHDQNVPVITGVDTRALTKYLRSKGTISGVITTSAKPSLELPAFVPVSISQPVTYNPGQAKTVIAVDCGMKENIMRSLLSLGVTVRRVPYDYDYTAEDYDGILVSNGPGDPTDYPETIKILAKALKGSKPIFGICLGIQIMALAAGAKTYKLLYGHRGHNQPAVTPEGHAYITSQNHGYAIDEKSLPAGWSVTFRNLNDDSVEGIAYAAKPFSAVQFHPEAAPGPTDTAWLFKAFGDKL